MKKTFKIVTILLLIVAFAFCLFACNNDEQKPGESSGTTVVMTESYERGRAEFKAVTGIELPALADITVEEFPYEAGATSYELDITEGVTHDTFDVIVEFLNTALASWTKEGPTTDGEYTNIWWRSNNGSIGITWDEHNTAVYVHAMMNANGQNNSNSGNNNNSNPSGGVTMTDGYARARNDFQTATGLLLPELEKVNGVWFADEKSLDIGGSTEENGATQATLEAVNAALQQQINVQPTVSGGRTMWTYSREKEGVTYQCMLASFYQREGTGGLVVLLYSEIAPEVDPTDSDVNMTASYKEGRKSFYQISGLLLPALENVELSDESVFDAQKKEARFIVANNNVFSSMVQAVKTALADEPLADNNKHWEQEGFMAFWEWDYEADGRMHKVTIQLENNTYTGKVTVGYWFRDYYTITLTATAGGSAELDIAGRSQSGNTAHVCYNTSSDLIATVTPGYRFLGFYEEETLLSAENPYEGYMIVKDVTIEARFEEIPSNMTEGYKTARNNLYAMSDIVLPALEDVTTDNETYDFDEENRVRDEFDCDFTFASAEAAAQAFTDFSAAIALVDGNAEESGESDAIWSKLYEDAVIPYRDDVMMFLNETHVFLMWRKQPIAFYNVTVEGEGGTADIVYTGANYEDVRVQRHWEIVDAFGGRIVATPAQGYEFDGWYVNGQLFSENADYRFRLSSEKTDPVDFTEITFVAKFVEAAVPTVQMTESYAEGREAFQTITGFLLPELSGCEVIGSSDLRTEQHTVACFDITGTANDMATIIEALQAQIDHEPSCEDEYGTTWNIDVEIDGTWYTGQIWAMLDAGSDYSFVYVNYCTGEVTNEYVEGRTIFYAKTGVLLPLIAGVEADYPPETAQDAILDLSGEDIDLSVVGTLRDFFDNLDGWNYDEEQYDQTESEGVTFDFYYYKNEETDAKIQIVWHRENGETVGVYINAFSNQ